MRRLSLGYILVLIAVAVLVPLPARADENNVCFASDPGAGNESKTAHYQWAQGKSADTLANNLAGKIAMVYNCDVVSGDQAARAFGDPEVDRAVAARAAVLDRVRQRLARRQLELVPLAVVEPETRCGGVGEIARA